MGGRGLRDLEKALAEITLIRSQMARGMEFRGLGAATLAATGALALAAGVAQALWLEEPARHVEAYLLLWIGVAAASVVLIGIETVTRTARAHSGLAQEMILAAVEQFLPAAVSGALLAVVLYETAPASLWMLPGLWQIIFALGVFASRRALPRAIALAGIWYLATGLLCLAAAAGENAFSPWAMGLPFGIGQALIALIVHRHGGDDGEA
jgi:hypothetical protein